MTTPDELTWSPDSSRVAYVMWDPTRTGLAIASLGDGSTQILLPQADRFIYEPTWAPDGQSLIATCRTEGARPC